MTIHSAIIRHYTWPFGIWVTKWLLSQGVIDKSLFQYFLTPATLEESIHQHVKDIIYASSCSTYYIARSFQITRRILYHSDYVVATRNTGHIFKSAQLNKRSSNFLHTIVKITF